MLLLTSDWPEYELLDSGNGQRLERFGKYILTRPDPQVLWKPHLDKSKWEAVDAFFDQKLKGEGGKWVKKTAIPDKWIMRYGDISFYAKLTPFKHTGVFPEQSAHWKWITEKIHKDRNVNIMNLFAYTGIASLVCAAAGAKVTHVDSARSTIGWARENQAVSKLEDKSIRWILDDALKFVKREIKRGVHYDAIIMDPPIYGHGPHGEVWDFTDDFPYLLNLCRQVLFAHPLFIIVNAYAISASFLMLDNMLSDLELPGVVESGEIVLKESRSKRMLSTGIFARWCVV